MRFKNLVVFIHCLVSITHAKNKTSSKAEWFNRIKQQIISKAEDIKNSSRFSGNIVNAIHSLNGYGCWCYFYDRIGSGAGQPVDEIDEICKVLADGYQCAMIDHENSGGRACIPWEISYQSGTGEGEDLWNSCNELNNDLCQRFSCAVEGQFTESLFNFLKTGQPINFSQFGHIHSNFDIVTTCHGMTHEEWDAKQQQEWKYDYCSAYYCPAANYWNNEDFYYNTPLHYDDGDPDRYWPTVCTGEYPFRAPFSRISWHNPIEIELNFGVNPLVFNRIFVKMKTPHESSGAHGTDGLFKLKRGSNSIYECSPIKTRVIGESNYPATFGKSGEYLEQIAKCGVFALNHYMTFDNSDSNYKLVIPSGLVLDPLTDIQVTPRLYLDYIPSSK